MDLNGSLSVIFRDPIPDVAHHSSVCQCSRRRHSIIQPRHQRQELTRIQHSIAKSQLNIMKTTLPLLALCSTIATSSAFTPAASFVITRQPSVTTTTTTATTPPSAAVTVLNMFSGGGEGAVKEDTDPDQVKAIEEAAKAMGMTVAEYQLGMNARMRFETAIGEMRYSAGNDDIGLQVDGRSPPNHLVITISEAGKQKGKDAVSAELAAAFKKTAADARTGRQAAQSDMMKFIQGQMK